MEVHPDCAPLAFLLGRWVGEGRGLWPATPQFSYREEVVIDHVGKPFLRYNQRTWSADGERPMHAETGYVRPVAGGGIELVVVQPTGIVEVHAGRVEGRVLDLVPVAVVATPSAKPVTGISRRVEVHERGPTLRYLVRIAMNGEPLADHLEATLRRVEQDDP